MEHSLTLRAYSEVVKKSYITTMNIRFYLRDYVNKEGKSPIYLSISSDGTRERIPMGLNVSPKDWDTKKQRVKPKAEDAENVNLILDASYGRLCGIRTNYRLAERRLTPSMLVSEFRDKTPNYDLISFMRYYLSTSVLSPASHKKNLSEIKKLSEFKNHISFFEINFDFINRYRSFLHHKKNNSATTIASSIKILLKYIRVAKRYGIPISINPDDIKPGSTKGNRTNLNLEEVAKLHDYYESKFITKGHKLALGYFLFSCYTSLRISDIKALQRADVLGNAITFKIKKSNKLHTIPLTKKAKAVIEHYPELFEEWNAEQKMNETLKKIAVICGIRKKIHFHVGRHSFATNFLRKGGKLEDLQVIMGHSNIETTMVYVHIVKAESIESIHLMDE